MKLMEFQHTAICNVFPRRINFWTLPYERSLWYWRQVELFDFVLDCALSGCYSTSLVLHILDRNLARQLNVQYVIGIESSRDDDRI